MQHGIDFPMDKHINMFQISKGRIANIFIHIKYIYIGYSIYIYDWSLHVLVNWQTRLRISS